MKILYGIQGTGNGHISRALEILPELKKRGDVDILVSGHQSELTLPVQINYQLQGLGFVFGKNGGIDLISTYKKSRLKQFYREVRDLDVNRYDLVISDFEPVSAWACMKKNKLSIGLSNQASLLSPNVPKSGSEDFVGRFIIKHYAPCSIQFGLSYERYDKDIYTPIIRKAIRELKTTLEDHYVVYLPAYSDERVVKALSEFRTHRFRLFSKTAKVMSTINHISIFPLDKQRFENNIASCRGIITAAGFGSTTEALFLGKKLLVIPQKHQYEQSCNALALKQMGVRVIKSIKPKHAEEISYWLEHDLPIQRAYPDITENLISDLIYANFTMDDPYHRHITNDQYLKTGN